MVKGAGDFESCYLRLNNPGRVDEELYTFVPNIGIDKAYYAASEIAMTWRFPGEDQGVVLHIQDIIGRAFHVPASNEGSSFLWCVQRG